MVNQNQQVEAQELACAINTSFDLEAAIAGLLTDVGSRSLELPCFLTPDQRNKAKLIAAQHKELKCESYGFGSDRRLHIFKKSATTCVRVKNTFVDGHSDADDEKDNDAPIFRLFRSEPGNLRERTPLYSIGRDGNGKLELPPLCKKRPMTVETEGTATPEGSEEAVTSDGSEDTLTPEESIGFATPEGSEGEISPSSPSRKATEEGPELIGESLCPAFPPGRFSFSVGTLVVIQGLVRAPQFNGRVGLVHSLDEATGRYDILLASPSSGPESNNQKAKVKYENLRRIACTRNDCSTDSTAA